MTFYFDDDFIKSVKKLLKKKSYKDCEKALIQDLLSKSFDEIKKHCLAKKLYGSVDKPIAKIRISYKTGKRRGYRLILIIYINDKKIHLGYIFPKTGNSKIGKDNLKPKEEIEVIKTMVNNINSKSYYEVHVVNDKIYYVSTNKSVWK